MALSHSPKIVTNGLVFYYDMSNTKKSNIGDTTTNLISNGDFFDGKTGWSNYVAASSSVVTVYDFPTALRSPKTVLQYDSPGTIGGGGNYGGFSRSAPALTSGTTYTISFTARSLSGNMTFAFSHQNGSGDNSNLYFNSTITSDWRRYTRTVSLDLVKNTIYFWNQNVSSGTFQVSDIQLEAKSTATTFTSTTRSATQSVLDLTGTRTITVNSLTYDNNGNFSFNGSSNYLTAASADTYSSYSIELWVKMNSLSGQQRLFSTPGGGTFTIRWNGSDFDFHYNPFDGSPASTVTSASGLTFSTTNYYHLVATNDPTNGARFYVNGVLRGTGERAIDLSSSPWYFGVDRTLTLWSNCILPSAKVYSKELSATDVQQNFNASRGRYGI
jgi:hypothetical protein